MSIIGNLRKTYLYAKRNGISAAIAAARERMQDNKHDNYIFMPKSAEILADQRHAYKMIAESGDCVRFSIVVPCYNTPEKYLRELIDSCVAQTYGDWELILADASESVGAGTKDGKMLHAKGVASDISEVSAKKNDEADINASNNNEANVRQAQTKVNLIASEYALRDPRIKYYHLESNDGISENTNRALDHASGDYVALLDHDDILTPNALFENARVIRARMKKEHLMNYSKCPIKLIYSDEDKFDDDKKLYYEHHAKPDFNLDYFMSNNYICHFTLIRADIIKSLRFRKEFDGAQDFDLFLRTVGYHAFEVESQKDSGVESNIVHIPQVLYHWRCHTGSTAANPASKAYAYEAGRRAVEDFLHYNGVDVQVENLPHVGFYRTCYGQQYQDIFAHRPDIGIVGGKILGKNGRISGGMMNCDGKVAFKGIPASYSGGLQHRAAVQQDATVVDIRNIICRPELADLVQEYQRMLAEGTFSRCEDGDTAVSEAKNKNSTGMTENNAASVDQESASRRGTSASADQKSASRRGTSASVNQQSVPRRGTSAGLMESDAQYINASIALCKEIKKRGYRIMWDPQMVKTI